MNDSPYNIPCIIKHDTNTNDVRENEQIKSVSEKIINDMEIKNLIDKEK